MLLRFPRYEYCKKKVIFRPPRNRVVLNRKGGQRPPTGNPRFPTSAKTGGQSSPQTYYQKPSQNDESNFLHNLRDAAGRVGRVSYCLLRQRMNIFFTRGLRKNQGKNTSASNHSVTGCHRLLLPREKILSLVWGQGQAAPEASAGISPVMESSPIFRRSRQEAPAPARSTEKSAPYGSQRNGLAPGPWERLETRSNFSVCPWVPTRH